MTIDIGVQAGRGRALDLLVMERAFVLVVPSLAQLARRSAELGYLCDTYFREGQPFSLLSVSDSIDTRSAGSKLLLNVDETSGSVLTSAELSAL